MLARVAAFALSLLWAVVCGIQGIGYLAFFFFGRGFDLVSFIESAAAFDFFAAVTTYSIWQFNVLRSPAIRELFEGPDLHANIVINEGPSRERRA